MKFLISLVLLALLSGCATPSFSLIPPKGVTAEQVAKDRYQCSYVHYWKGVSYRDVDYACLTDQKGYRLEEIK